jgi:hypothetical protein
MRSFSCGKKCMNLRCLPRTRDHFGGLSCFDLPLHLMLLVTVDTTDMLRVTVRRDLSLTAWLSSTHFQSSFPADPASLYRLFVIREVTGTASSSSTSALSEMSSAVKARGAKLGSVGKASASSSVAAAATTGAVSAPVWTVHGVSDAQMHLPVSDLFAASATIRLYVQHVPVPPADSASMQVEPDCLRTDSAANGPVSVFASGARCLWPVYVYRHDVDLFEWRGLAEYPSRQASASTCLRQIIRGLQPDLAHEFPDLVAWTCPLHEPTTTRGPGSTAFVPPSFAADCTVVDLDAPLSVHSNSAPLSGAALLVASAGVEADVIGMQYERWCFSVLVKFIALKSDGEVSCELPLDLRSSLEDVRDALATALGGVASDTSRVQLFGHDSIRELPRQMPLRAPMDLRAMLTSFTKQCDRLYFTLPMDGVVMDAPTAARPIDVFVGPHFTRTPHVVFVDVQVCW